MSMSQDFETTTEDRRSFLKQAVLVGASLTLPGLSAKATASIPVTLEADPGDPVFFNAQERAVVSRLADGIYPDATKLGAIRFIETLMTAMEFDPPRIFAAREGDTFIPLTRMQEKAWRIHLYGDKNNKGLRDQMLACARDKTSSDTFLELVLQGLFALPAYGGNRDYQVWKGIAYDGQQIPQGYSRYNSATNSYEEYPQTPLSTANPGADPNPIGFFTRLGIRVVVLTQKGRFFF